MSKGRKSQAVTVRLNKAQVRYTIAVIDVHLKHSTDNGPSRSALSKARETLRVAFFGGATRAATN